MVIGDTTVKILQNFAGIGGSILLVPGEKQRTMASGKSVLAVAEFPEPWPQETGIYDLNAFLGALSLYTKPEITFEADAMVIKSGNARLRYRYSDPSTILTPPNKVLPTANPKVEFTLFDGALHQLNKTCRMLSLPIVTVGVKNGVVTVTAADAKNSASHAYEYTVPAADVKAHDDTFSNKLDFKQEHVAMLLDGSYSVSISTWPYAHFSHQSVPVQYFVVAQQ
jgi:hypothetical protein